MNIRITRGMYGFVNNGNVIEKTKSDPPFEVDDEEGKRLIALKVAKFVDVSEKTDGTVGSPEEDDAEGDFGHISKEDLENMSKEDLCRLAEKFGIKKNGSKTDLVERLRQCSVLYEDEDEEPMGEGEMPVLKPEDPE